MLLNTSGGICGWCVAYCSFNTDEAGHDLRAVAALGSVPGDVNSIFAENSWGQQIGSRKKCLFVFFIDPNTPLSSG